jgi:predicted N-formylglutamate amidohydrolase
MGRHLADLLDCPAVIGGFSRLVLDLNRLSDHPEQIPPISDGVVIAPNQGLSEAEKAARREALFWPYQNEIGRRLAEIEAAGMQPVLLSIHSFTPQLAYGGQPRPWHVGILWKEDLRLAGHVMTSLKARGDLVVGDNEPYDRRAFRTQTVEVHGEDVGRLNLLVEVRQDLLKTQADEVKWAEVLHQSLPSLADLKAA